MKSQHSATPVFGSASDMCLVAHKSPLSRVVSMSDMIAGIGDEEASFVPRGHDSGLSQRHGRGTSFL